MHFKGTLAFSPDATMDENLTSNTIELQGEELLSVTLHAASSTHVGTVHVDCSDDGANWNEETLSSAPAAASGSALDARIEIETAARFVRVRYTYTSGTGTLTGSFTAKE